MRINNNHKQNFGLLNEDQKSKCSQVFKIVDRDNSGSVDKEGLIN